MEPGFVGLALKAPCFTFSSWTFGHLIAVSVIWKKALRLDVEHFDAPFWRDTFKSMGINQLTYLSVHCQKILILALIVHPQPEVLAAMI
jgi:hypothetical protein